MNYIIKDGKKYAKIYLDHLNEKLSLVNDNFRIIILAENTFINNIDLSFLNRFEKISFSFDKLLDNNLKRIASNLIEEINLNYVFNKFRNNINYSLEDLIINCREEEIQALIYYFYYFSKEIKDKNNEKELMQCN